MEQASSLIDLSHVIESGMITYKGLPGPQMSDHLSREASRAHYTAGTEFHIGKIEMVANTGTYVDSPFHRYPKGKDLSQLPLSALANLEGRIVRSDWKSGRAINRDAFTNLSLNGKAVLICTGWDVHWRTEQYFSGHPYLTRDAVEHLIENKVALVGIDSLNIDDTADLTRPAHTLFLAAGIPIVEHLCNLSSLPDEGFRFFAVPAPLKAFGSFPVRAYAIVP